MHSVDRCNDFLFLRKLIFTGSHWLNINFGFYYCKKTFVTCIRPRDYLIPCFIFCRIGSNELLGCTAIGNSFIGMGRDHWLEMLDNPRKPVAQWYPLLEIVPGQIPPCNSQPLPVSLSCLNTRWVSSAGVSWISLIRRTGTKAFGFDSMLTDEGYLAIELACQPDEGPQQDLILLSFRCGGCWALYCHD